MNETNIPHRQVVPKQYADRASRSLFFSFSCCFLSLNSWSSFLKVFFQSFFFEDLFHDINSLFVTRLGNHRPQLTLPSFLLLSN
jgi:hypothetical protein